MEHVAALRRRFPDLEVALLNLENPGRPTVGPADIVYYGTLYRLSRPAEAIACLNSLCKEMLPLETCVSFGRSEELNPVPEREYSLSQALSGTGCRPTRRWVYSQLKRHFERVYLPVTQPCILTTCGAERVRLRLQQ